MTEIVSLLWQDSISISQAFLYVFPLLPQIILLVFEQDGVEHAHWAVPLAVTMHMAFGGQVTREQGDVGLPGIGQSLVEHIQGNRSAAKHKNILSNKVTKERLDIKK